MGNYHWNGVDNSNGYNGWWPNPGVKTDGIPMPVFRQGRAGNPFRLGAVHRDYAAGPGSIWQGIYYAGVETQGHTTFGGSGGQFTFFIRGSSGTLQFGRCVGCGRTVQSENEAFAWGGTLAGSFDWVESPTAPQAFSATLQADQRTINFSAVGSADGGGTGIFAYVRQMQVNGGAWHDQRTDWGTPFVGTPGNSYRFELWAHNNSALESLSTYTAVINVPYAGGRRATGPTTTTPLTTSKRFNGSAWVDLTTKKRYNGSAFVDISN